MQTKIIKLSIVFLALIVFMTACGQTDVMQECNNCGESIGIDAKFCSNCGTEIFLDNEDDVPSELEEQQTACAHIWIDATCSLPRTCQTCGTTEGETIQHAWKDATCSAPKTCQNCGATEGMALNHNWQNATCASPQKCQVCGIAEGGPLPHAWQNATCSAPKTCQSCGATDGAALSHNWQSATCTSPQKCTICGVTNGDANGHQWMNATYEYPMYCAICGIESGEPLVDVDYDKYVMAAHLYQAVIDSAKFPSSVRIERAYYISDLGRGYPAVRLECAAANSLGGYGILYGVVIQYPAVGYEDDPYADHIYVYEDTYCFECNIYDSCPVLNYDGYEKLDISRIEDVHEKILTSVKTLSQEYKKWLYHFTPTLVTNYQYSTIGA